MIIQFNSIQFSSVLVYERAEKTGRRPITETAQHTNTNNKRQSAGHIRNKHRQINKRTNKQKIHLNNSFVHLTIQNAKI